MSEDGTGAACAASDTNVDPISASSPVEDTRPIELDRARADRQALIQLCLYALDRARSAGVAERIEQGLADVGVRAVRPDGERFDPSRHEAGAAVPTDDAVLVGSIAETEMVGFSDDEGALRVPVVTVYTPPGR